MKNRNIVLLFIFVSLISCIKQENKQFEKIQLQFNMIQDTTDADYKKLLIRSTSLKKQIDDFMIEYSNSDYNVELEIFKHNIDEAVNRAKIKQLQQEYAEFINDRYSSYESYWVALDTMKTKTLGFLNDSLKNMSNSEIKNIEAEINDIKENLLREKLDYESLNRNFQQDYNYEQASQEITDIKIFLSNYPISIKGDELKNRIKNLEYLKFEIDAEKELKNIAELNRHIKVLEDYKKKVHSKVVNKINSTITGIEGMRSTIFKNEFENKLERLDADMHLESFSKAFDTHSICGFYSEVPIIEKNKSTLGDMAIYEHTYTYEMKGGMLCNSRYKTVIRVTGNLDGNKEEGVKQNISSVLVSNNKY